MPQLPKITIVTPNYNLAAFLEHTIASVLGQNYPNLEYMIIDGGSTDGSVEIIRRYADRLAYWTSRPDKGHFYAIEEGLKRSSGEIMGWLNSDDMYFPGALSVVGEIFSLFPEVEWLTTIHPAGWNEQGQNIGAGNMVGYSKSLFLRGGNGPLLGEHYGRGYIQQESTLWRRSLWERAGGHLDTSVTLAADFELWARFFDHDAELYGVQSLLGGFRLRSGQKTQRFQREYEQQCHEVLRRYGGRLCGRWESVFRRYGARFGLPLLKRIPGARRMGLVFPVKRFAHEGGESSWKLREAVIV